MLLSTLQRCRSLTSSPPWHRPQHRRTLTDFVVASLHSVSHRTPIARLAPAPLGGAHCWSMFRREWMANRDSASAQPAWTGAPAPYSFVLVPRPLSSRTQPLSHSVRHACTSLLARVPVKARCRAMGFAMTQVDSLQTASVAQARAGYHVAHFAVHYS